MASIRASIIKPTIRLAARWLVNSNTAVAEQRRRFELFNGAVPAARGVAVQSRPLPSCSSEWLVSAELLASDRVMLYLHGGGYIIGSPRAYRSLTSQLAKRLGCPVLVPDYRLAPEHPFPAALDDAYDAWHYLLQQGYKPEQIMLAGDSAGGGLATALLLKLRDNGKPLPAACFVISPLYDLTYSGDSITACVGKDPLLNLPWLESGAAQYAGGESLEHPYLSPVFADATGLPPMLIHVGSEELLLDDARRFAERAKQAGVPLAIDVWEGMWHDWHLQSMILPEGNLALNEAVNWLLKTQAADERHPSRDSGL